MIKTMYIYPKEIIEHYGYNLVTGKTHAFIEPIDHVYKRLLSVDKMQWNYNIKGISNQRTKELARSIYFKETNISIQYKLNAKNRSGFYEKFQNPNIRNGLGNQILVANNPYIWLAGYILGITGSIHDSRSRTGRSIDIILPSSFANSILDDSYPLKNYFDTSIRKRYGSTLYVYLRKNHDSLFDFDGFFNFIVSLYGYSPFNTDSGFIFTPSVILTADKTVKMQYIEGLRESNKYWNHYLGIHPTLTKIFTNRSSYLTYRLLLDSANISYITDQIENRGLSHKYTVNSDGMYNEEPFDYVHSLEHHTKRINQFGFKDNTYGYQVLFSDNIKSTTLNGITIHND